MPCCYDYAAELKVGNINDKPLTQIWNSPEYMELRKKIYFNKIDIPKCKVCTINYKLADGGWFPEAHDFNVGLKKQFVEQIHRLVNYVLQ